MGTETGSGFNHEDGDDDDDDFARLLRRELRDVNRSRFEFDVASSVLVLVALAAAAAIQHFPAFSFCLLSTKK